MLSETYSMFSHKTQTKLRKILSRTGRDNRFFDPKAYFRVNIFNALLDVVNNKIGNTSVLKGVVV